MPLFYFDVYDGISGLDRIGKDCVDRQAAAREAARQAEELLADEGDWFGTGQEWQIGVSDSTGAVVFDLRFRSSVQVDDTIYHRPHAS